MTTKLHVLEIKSSENQSVIRTYLSTIYIIQCNTFTYMNHNVTYNSIIHAGLLYVVIVYSHSCCSIINDVMIMVLS